MPTDAGQRATLWRREGAKGRRERRLRAEARVRLQLCRDAVRIASHRTGELAPNLNDTYFFYTSCSAH